MAKSCDKLAKLEQVADKINGLRSEMIGAIMAVDENHSYEALKAMGTDDLFDILKYLQKIVSAQSYL